MKAKWSYIVTEKIRVSDSSIMRRAPEISATPESTREVGDSDDMQPVQQKAAGSTFRAESRSRR